MKQLSLLNKTLSYKLEVAPREITGHAGLVLLYELAATLGLVKTIDEIMPAPGSNRGFHPHEYIMPLILMFCGGGRSFEDIRTIASDPVLRRICRLPKVPSPDAIGRWLRRNRQHLRRLKRISRRLVQRIIAASQLSDFTLDTDATYMATDKSCAEYNYKGIKSFSVLLSFLAELDVCTAAAYRNGNQSPVTGILEQLTDTWRFLQHQGKRLSGFRSDSAGYCADVINFCREHGIRFAITADQDSAVKKEIARLGERGWTRLFDERHQPTDRWYKTAVHCQGKTELPFTMVVVRWPNPDPDLFVPQPYCYHIIATSDSGDDAAATIAWHNQRSNAENYNKELKGGYGMEYAPSQLLRANAVYFEIGLLAYHLVTAFKRMLLDRSWWHRTIATLRWRILEGGGYLVRRGRRLVLRVTKGIWETLQQARQVLKNGLVPI